YIGTNAAGAAAAGNGGDGITVVGGSVMIGGTTPAERNVISGNAAAGVDCYGDGPRIIGNYIGTNASGNAPLGNGREGIRASITGEIAAVIGGAGAAGNVISANAFSGILVDGGRLDVTARILGNYIGT